MASCATLFRRSFANFIVAMLIVRVSSAHAAECKLNILADLPAKMDGLRVSVPVKINGRDTSFWLDSGAFFSIMSQAKASEFGLKLEALPSGFFLSGLGGRVTPMLTTVKSFGIVGNELKNVEFLVGGSDAGSGLIGSNILGLADTEFDLAHGSVKLVSPKDCEHAVFAYWAPGAVYFTTQLMGQSNAFDRIPRLQVSINGVKITAALDSGAPTSLISRRAADRAGIDLSGQMRSEYRISEDLGGVLPPAGLSRLVGLISAMKAY